MSASSVVPTFKVAYAIGDKTDIVLHIKEYDSFQHFAQAFKDPLEGTKGTVGYFIRGSDLKKYEKYTTGSDKEFFDIYPRCDEALLSADLLVVDADRHENLGPAPHLRTIHEVLILEKINHFGYTTSSHTEEEPKCRVVIPCKIKRKEDLIPTVAKLQSLLDAHNCKPRAGGKEMFTWSVPWFFPTKTENYQFVEYYKGTDFRAVESGTYEAEHVCLEADIRHPQNGMSLAEAYPLLESGASGFHNALHCAAWYFQKTLGEKQAIAVLTELTRHQAKNPVRKEIPGYIADIPRLVKSAAKKSNSPIPFPLPRYHFKSDFPTNIMPPLIYDVADMISGNIQVSFEFPAMFAFGIIALACGDRVTVHEISGIDGEGHAYKMSTWIMVILPSGERKTPVVKKLIIPLKKAETYLKEKRVFKSYTAKAEIKSLEERIKEKEKELGSDGHSGDFEEIAMLNMQIRDLQQNLEDVQLFTTDATEEAVKDLASMMGGIVGIVTAEGTSAIRNIVNQYGDTPKASTLLALYSGDDIRVNRIGYDKPIIIDDGVLNMVATIQPQAYSLFRNVEAFKDLGLFSRMVEVMPQRMIGRRTKASRKYADYDHSFQKAYNELIYDLLTNTEPIEIRMDADAQRIYEDFYDEVEISMARGNENYQYAGLINKLPSETVKYAGVFSLCNKPEVAKTGGELLISENPMQRAVRLARHQMKVKIYGENQNAHEMEIELAVEIINKLRSKHKSHKKLNELINNGYFTSGNLTSVLKIKKEVIEVALGHAVDYGWLIGSFHSATGTVRYSLVPEFFTAQVQEVEEKIEK